MQATTPLSSALTMAGLLLLPLTALAADPATTAAPGNILTVGGGAAVVSSYSGSDKIGAVPFIVLDYSMANGFYASTTRGLGFGGQAGPLTYNLALGYRGERTDHKRSGANGFFGGSDYLKGMGTIKGSATALASVAYSPVPGIQLTLASETPLSHRENGGKLTFGASGQVYAKKDSQGAQQDTLTLGVETSWGEKKYVQTMYGVTATQAANSAFRQYTPKGSFYEAQASINWSHRIDAQWGVTTLLGVNTLLGDAGKSPIVQRKTTPMGAVFVTYSY